MAFKTARRTVASLLLSMLLLLTACTTQAPSRYDQAQQQSTQRNAPSAVAKDAQAGGSFNQFFPDSGNGFERVFSQEKKGVALAKLKKGGKDVAILSISDTTTDTASGPNAAAKFQQSTQQIGGYPAVQQGNNGTAVLVGNRYQVKVQSRDPSFTESDRQAWLQKFNLRGLSRLK